jgi:ABC-type multidrug transport system ATPase subunit
VNTINGLSLTSSDLFGGCEYGVVFRSYKCYSGIGDDLFFLGITTVVYLGIAILVDVVDSIPALRNYFVIKDKSDPDGRPGVTLEDQNVLAEKRRVEVLDKSVPMLYVNKARKLFRRGGTAMRAFFAKIRGDKQALQDTTVYAVESVSFAADKGQVFGLLGVNGAGKTTTFKMLCGLYCPSGGEIFVMGQDATRKMDQVRKHVGYCPQFDALWDLLTPREHVTLYAKIRGYSGKELTEVVNTKLTELDLLDYTDVPAGTLSGGNKRKLSVAMALVGEPELVFLDEPSCGMDPFARRSMWNIIESVAERRKQCVIVLTTHSMEEAEALCSRIAIQVDGRFRVLGSCQEIKSMYGDGFEISVRAKESNVEKSVNEILQEISVTESSSHVLIETAMQLAGKDAAQALRFKHASYGLVIPPDHAQVSVFEIANWLYRDQIFGHVVDFLISQFTPTGFEVVELHGLTLKVKVSKLQISSLFRQFKNNKDAIRINDFQISQSPLEQIFNRFAATAKNRTE